MLKKTNNIFNKFEITIFEEGSPQIQFYKKTSQGALNPLELVSGDSLELEYQEEAYVLVKPIGAQSSKVKFTFVETELEEEFDQQKHRRVLLILGIGGIVALALGLSLILGLMNSCSKNNSKEELIIESKVAEVDLNLKNSKENNNSSGESELTKPSRSFATQSVSDNSKIPKTNNNYDFGKGKFQVFTQFKASF